MADRLILDTGVMIALHRGRLDMASFDDDADVTVPAVAVAEFLAGAELAHTAELRSSVTGFLDALLQIVPVDAYTTEVARQHAVVLAHTRRVGRTRSSHDLIIAATAASTGRTLLTTDAAADFGSLPDVAARVVPTG